MIKSLSGSKLCFMRKDEGLDAQCRSQRLRSPGHILPLKHGERVLEPYSVHGYTGPAMGRSHVQDVLPKGCTIYSFIS
jgi:hypothetical protein